MYVGIHYVYFNVNVSSYVFLFIHLLGKSIEVHYEVYRQIKPSNGQSLATCKVRDKINLFV
jgi:hypothetical protein